MAFLGLIWKARNIEKCRSNYEQEKLNSIRNTNTLKPKQSLFQRWVISRAKMRVGNVFLKFYPPGSSMEYCCYYMNTDLTFPNFVVKSVIGFVGGIILTYLCFLFFVFQLSISLIHATLMSSIIGVLLTLGLAFSYRIRCLVFLLIPQFFSRVGRYTITCYALVLILTGPATNTLKNSEVLSESMACGQEQIKTTMNQINKSTLKPLDAMNDNIKRLIYKLTDLSKKINEILVRLNRLVLALAHTLHSSINWLHSVSKTCNKKLGIPHVLCTEVFKNSVADCQANFGPRFNWLCNAAYVANAACSPVKNVRNFCMVLDFVDGNILATIPANMKIFTNRVKAILDLEVTIHHSYTYSSNESKSASQVAAGIVTEIRNRADPLLTWLSWSSCVTSLFLLLIIFRAKEYQHMFETRSRFDNRFITKELRNIDLKRHLQGRETILPLNRREKTKYIETTSLRLISSEKFNLTRSIVFMALTTFKLMIHMVADYSLFWVLRTIRYHGRFQSSTDFASPHVELPFQTSGLASRVYRAIVEALRVPLISIPTTPITCLPDPSPPDFNRYSQIGILIFLLWFFALFEPYGLRLRHLIMGLYSPERAKARAAWLYNHIQRTRGSFMKCARRKLHREYKYSTEQKHTFRRWLDSHIPFWCLRALCGTLPDPPRCLLCGITENNKDVDAILIRCKTPDCPGTYCVSCFSDIGQLCTICLSPEDYGDMSDVSLEKGSDDGDEVIEDSDLDDDVKRPPPRPPPPPVPELDLDTSDTDDDESSNLLKGCHRKKETRVQFSQRARFKEYDKKGTMKEDNRNNNNDVPCDNFNNNKTLRYHRKKYKSHIQQHTKLKPIYVCVAYQNGIYILNPTHAKCYNGSIFLKPEFSTSNDQSVDEKTKKYSEFSKRIKKDREMNNYKSFKNDSRNEFKKNTKVFSLMSSVKSYFRNFKAHRYKNDDDGKVVVDSETKIDDSPPKHIFPSVAKKKKKNCSDLLKTNSNADSQNSKIYMFVSKSDSTLLENKSPKITWIYKSQSTDEMSYRNRSTKKYIDNQNDFNCCLNLENSFSKSCIEAVSTCFKSDVQNDSETVNKSYVFQSQQDISKVNENYDTFMKYITLSQEPSYETSNRIAAFLAEGTWMTTPFSPGYKYNLKNRLRSILKNPQDRKPSGSTSGETLNPTNTREACVSNTKSRVSPSTYNAYDYFVSLAMSERNSYDNMTCFCPDCLRDQLSSFQSKATPVSFLRSSKSLQSFGSKMHQTEYTVNHLQTELVDPGVSAHSMLELYRKIKTLNARVKQCEVSTEGLTKLYKKISSKCSSQGCELSLSQALVIQRKIRTLKDQLAHIVPEVSDVKMKTKKSRDKKKRPDGKHWREDSVKYTHNETRILYNASLIPDRERESNERKRKESNSKKSMNEKSNSRKSETLPTQRDFLCERIEWASDDKRRQNKSVAVSSKRSNDSHDEIKPRRNKSGTSQWESLNDELRKAKSLSVADGDKLQVVCDYIKRNQEEMMNDPERLKYLCEGIGRILNLMMTCVCTDKSKCGACKLGINTILSHMVKSSANMRSNTTNIGIQSLQNTYRTRKSKEVAIGSTPHLVDDYAESPEAFERAIRTTNNTTGTLVDILTSTTHKKLKDKSTHVYDLRKARNVGVQRSGKKEVGHKCVEANMKANCRNIGTMIGKALNSLRIINPKNSPPPSRVEKRTEKRLINKTGTKKYPGNVYSTHSMYNQNLSFKPKNSYEARTKMESDEYTNKKPAIRTEKKMPKTRQNIQKHPLPHPKPVPIMKRKLSPQGSLVMTLRTEKGQRSKTPKTRPILSNRYNSPPPRQTYAPSRTISSSESSEDDAQYADTKYVIRHEKMTVRSPTMDSRMSSCSSKGLLSIPSRLASSDSVNIDENESADNISSKDQTNTSETSTHITESSPNLSSFDKCKRKSVLKKNYAIYNVATFAYENLCAKKNKQNMRIAAFNKINQGTHTTTHVVETGTRTSSTSERIFDGRRNKSTTLVDSMYSDRKTMKSCSVMATGRTVTFQSTVEIIPDIESIMSPSKYLLESQKYYNELYPKETDSALSEQYTRVENDTAENPGLHNMRYLLRTNFRKGRRKGKSSLIILSPTMTDARRIVMPCFQNKSKSDHVNSTLTGRKASTASQDCPKSFDTHVLSAEICKKLEKKQGTHRVKNILEICTGNPNENLSAQPNYSKSCPELITHKYRIQLKRIKKNIADLKTQLQVWLNVIEKLIDENSKLNKESDEKNSKIKQLLELCKSSVLVTSKSSSNDTSKTPS